MYVQYRSTSQRVVKSSVSHVSCLDFLCAQTPMVKPLDVPASYEEGGVTLFGDLLPRAAAAALESFRSAAKPLVGLTVESAKVGYADAQQQ